MSIIVKSESSPYQRARQKGAVGALRILRKEVRRAVRESSRPTSHACNATQRSRVTHRFPWETSLFRRQSFHTIVRGYHRALASSE